MNSTPDVFTTSEAAAFLGVHVETVRRLARRGDIPSFKVGKDWRFRRDTLLRWSDGGQERAPRRERADVLVVDDEERVCRALSRMLDRIGCEARTATSGARGLVLVAQQKPDLVLLDLKMPNMNGPQFLEVLRAQFPTLPVVIVTAYPDGDLMQKAMPFAPLMLLEKPVDEDLFERTVRMALGTTEWSAQVAR